MLKEDCIASGLYKILFIRYLLSSPHQHCKDSIISSIGEREREIMGGEGGGIFMDCVA